MGVPKLPGFDGIETTENYYDEKSRLAAVKTTGLADTLNVYDELGNLIRSGLDIDGSGSLEPASADRLSDTETAYALLDGIWWQQTRQAVYAVQNDGTATTTSLQQQRLTGLGNEGLTAETVSTDIHGNQTIQQVFVDRANATETRMIDYPDSTTDAVSVMVRGLLVSETDKSGVEQTFSYDALGRRTGTNDPRTGTASIHYNNRGRVDYIEDPAGNRTLYAYDPATGRKSTETNALGSVTRYEYNDRGQVTHTWGDATYPVRYTYDAYGQMSQMHTYRSDFSWSGDTWPSAAADSSDVTIWHYQESTGLLTAKEDAAGQQVTYTYTDGGKLDTRT